MKALCLVAHPDDCVIFAYSYIYNHPEHEWTIGYLTYTEQDPRGAELAEFWKQKGIPCVFLGYVDNYRDIETKQISFDTVAACNDMQQLASQYELVLTHDAQGDYGHLHHAFVHQSVFDHPHLVTFAKPGHGTVTYSVPAGTYSADQLPQHWQVIAGFFPTGTHTNSYTEVTK